MYSLCESRIYTSTVVLITLGCAGVQSKVLCESTLTVYLQPGKQELMQTAWWPFSVRTHQEAVGCDNVTILPQKQQCVNENTVIYVINDKARADQHSFDSWPWCYWFHLLFYANFGSDLKFLLPVLCQHGCMYLDIVVSAFREDNDTCGDNPQVECYWLWLGFFFSFIFCPLKRSHKRLTFSTTPAGCKSSHTGLIVNVEMNIAAGSASNFPVLIWAVLIRPGVTLCHPYSHFLNVPFALFIWVQIKLFPIGPNVLYLIGDLPWQSIIAHNKGKR